MSGLSLAQVSCLVITDLSLFLLHTGKELEALKGEVAWLRPSCLEMSIRSTGRRSRAIETGCRCQDLLTLVSAYYVNLKKSPELLFTVCG